MGYERDTSPWLDEFSERCLVFDRAYTPKAQTEPAFLSLWSGLHPRIHNHQRNGLVISDDIHFLVEDFYRAGYQTVGIPAAGVLASKYGIDRGFNTYFDCTAHDIKAPAVIETVGNYLEGDGYDPDNGRLFLFVHLFDPHTDYEPDPDILAQFADPYYSGPVDGTIDMLREYNDYEREFTEADLQHVTDLYDAEIRTLDDYIAELFDVFERNGLMEDSIVIFTADHGENLGEHHYITHGHPYEKGLHIPLMFHFPDEKGAGIRVDSLVELTDLLPTLMEMLDVPIPDGINGMSFLDILDDPENATVEDGRAFSLATGGWNENDERTYSLFDGRYRLTENIIWSDESLLYDILFDPLEENDIASENPELAEAHLAIIEALAAEAGPDVEQEMDTETRELLESLGYI